MDQAILLFFEKIRCTELTWFFGFISFFGEAITVGAIIILLWWLIGGRTGEQLLFTAISSAAMNSMMKCAVHRPRPYAAGVVERLDVDTPFFTTRGLGDNLSFPSGHAQATTSALITGAFRGRRFVGWLIATLCILLVCASRLYFGVHYPTDVLAGALFGLLVAVFWELIFREAYKYRYMVLMAFALFVLFTVPFAPEKDFLQMAGLLSGGAFFLPLVSFLRYDGPKKKWRRVFRIPVGLIAAGAVFAATMLLPADPGFTLLKWFLITGAGTFLATVFFKILRI